MIKKFRKLRSKAKKISPDKIEAEINAVRKK